MVPLLATTRSTFLRFSLPFSLALTPVSTFSRVACFQYTDPFLKSMSLNSDVRTVAIIYNTSPSSSTFTISTCAEAVTYANAYGLNVTYFKSFNGLNPNFTATIGLLVDEVGS